MWAYVWLECECDVIAVVVKVQFRKTSICASAADSRNKSKQIWSEAAKHIVQHKELKKIKNKIKRMWS